MARTLSPSPSLPLGTIEIEPVGWDLCRFLQLGRACWNIKRNSFEPVAVSYRNLISEQEWQLGEVSPATTDHNLLSWIAGNEDLRPGDWINLGGRLIAVTFERGSA